ncbi:MAG: sulfatase-like hydrolase/transferase [Verrucomicrobiota bacterium]|nr:sulfatase-like hydrolase/transferase [Verrucomicrobiota bacterium]
MHAPLVRQLALFFACAFALIAGTSTHAATATKPNLIFILADDLGYGDLGLYGCPDIRTPVLDRMAREGIWFTDAYASGPLCSPTRAAFVTGRYQQRLGNHFEDFVGGGAPGLDATKHVTIAQSLKQAGYRTACFGKWNLAGGLDQEKFEYSPMAHGFDSWIGAHVNHDFHTHRRERTGEPDFWKNGKPFTATGYTDDLLTDYTLDFIEESGDRPFIIYLAYLIPHNPLQAPDDPAIQPPGHRPTYVKMVERQDHNVGRVLDGLRRRGLDKNTLVIFTSDNGGQVAARNLPLSGRKAQLLEGGIRVPFIMWWPGVIPGGQKMEQLAITMDATVTMLTAAGVSARADQPMDGIDLMPVATGKSPAAARTLYFRSRNVDFRQRTNEIDSMAIREGDWKLYIRRGAERLYHLKKDIAEQNDLRREQPELAARLKARLEAWEKEVTPAETPFPARPAPETPPTREEM